MCCDVLLKDSAKNLEPVPHVLVFVGNFRHPSTGRGPQGFDQQHQKVAHCPMVRPADDLTQEWPWSGELRGKRLLCYRDPPGENHCCILVPLSSD